MLNREQIHALLMIRNRLGNVLSGASKDVIKLIANVGFNKDVLPLLQHIANNDVDEVRSILAVYPHFVLDYGHTTLRSGTVLKYVTPYQVAAGYPEMAPIVQAAFKEIRDTDGKQVESALKERDVTKFLHHVVLGQEVEAKAMLDVNPKLLLERGNVVDYSGRKIIGQTALQLAFGAEDELMVEMFSPYFEQLQYGAALRLQQFAEFEEGCEEQAPYDFSTLIEAFNTNDPATYNQAVAEFKAHFQPGVIRNGKHFNPQDFLGAMDAYNDNIDTWKVVGWERLDKFWKEVIGHLQRLLPACYAQAFCTGLKPVSDDPKKLQRTLTLNGGDYVYYPLDVKSNFRLGQDFAVYSWGARRAAWWDGAVGRGCGRGLTQLVSKLMASKNSKLTELGENFRAAIHSNHDKKGCLIC